MKDLIDEAAMSVGPLNVQVKRGGTRGTAKCLEQISPSQDANIDLHISDLRIGPGRNGLTIGSQNRDQPTDREKLISSKHPGSCPSSFGANLFDEGFPLEAALLRTEGLGTIFDLDIIKSSPIL